MCAHSSGRTRTVGGSHSSLMRLLKLLEKPSQRLPYHRGGGGDTDSVMRRYNNSKLTITLPCNGYNTPTAMIALSSVLASGRLWRQRETKV